MARRTALNVESLETRELLSGLSINLTTDASSYQVGHPVQLTFTETNNSSSPVTIDEGPSNDGFIVEQDGSTVWRSNAGINPLFIVADTLQPGQSLTLTGTWNGIPNVGSSTGTAVTDTFVVLNQLAPATTATFQIDSSSKPASDGSSGSTSSSTAAPILTPVDGTPVSTTSTSEHRHAVHPGTHLAKARLTHVPQSLSGKHHSRSGAK